ncbi:MAG: stress protection protein MarC [Lautropia sp.]|nr:MAG: MarC family NAAT transporter [Pseudomonadota bacterium]MBC6960127.1 stress protection protein MarC [Lautropia sp.]MCL4703091.1 MarC family NAAT transporter [Burkholderiaceae bacterium]MDL1906465.1 MarC family NAAT transporter [Betaproteobacteria bacterium PRO1]RIK90120.1 MAG: stress protection protein MarC [Burkholderiales bacterium]
MAASAIGLFASFFLGSFFGLVTIINPPSAIPLFNALSAPLDERGADRLARDASVYVFAILTVSLFAGGLILASFGISYGALRIAGGIVVASLGHGMLFGRDERGTPEAGAARNPAFFPLALPGISGPGSIAVIIGISTEIREIGGWADTLIAWTATVAAIVCASLLTWLVLRSARSISNRLGPNGIEVMTRLMGFLLICIGVQFVASGIRTFVSGI